MSREMSCRTREEACEFPDSLLTRPLSRDVATDIGRFLLRINAELRPECDDGTVEGASYYVTRLLDHHQTDRNFDLSLQASTVIYDGNSDQVVGVCMLGGGEKRGQTLGIYDIVVDPVFRRQGLALNMIRKALGVLHGVATELLLEVDDDNGPAQELYRKLGFLFRDELPYWREEILRICRGSGLPEPSRIEPGNPSVNYAFLVGDKYVVKFCGDEEKWFNREIELLKALPQCGLTYSKLHASGRTTDPPGHLYMLRQLVPGDPWWRMRHTMSMPEKLAVAERVGDELAMLHGLSPSSLKRIAVSEANWKKMLMEYEQCTIKGWERRHPKILRQVKSCMSLYRQPMDDLAPVVGHNDLHGDHIRIVTDNGISTYSGMIDFGDVDCSELEYELVKVHLDSFECDKHLTNACLAAYRKRRPATISLDKCKLYSLIHRFSELTDYLDMDDLCDSNDGLQRQLDRIWQGVDCEESGPQADLRPHLAHAAVTPTPQ